VDLGGTATANASASIAHVETGLRYCAATLSPQFCADPANLASEIGRVPFSGTDLPQPIAVVAGQIVQVTVTLTFS
jgi:hypothetical protein